MNLGTLLHRKAEAIAAAGQILASAKAASRKLSADEESKYEAALSTIKEVDGAVTSMAAGNGNGNRNSILQSIHDQLGGLRSFARGDIRADISVGGDGSAILPVLPAQQIFSISPGADTLAAAGATVEDNLPNGLARKWAFLVPAANVTTYSEGSGPSSSNEPNLYAATVPLAYFADLVKTSIQAWQDLPELTQTQLLISMTQNAIFSANAAGVGDLVTALQGSSGGYAIDEYSDLFQGVLNMIGRIHSTFRNPDNAFLIGRPAYEKLFNVRDSIGRPILNAVADGQLPNTLFGYRLVVDESLSTKVVFGNFAKGVYIARTGLWMQRLTEAFQSTNEYGLKSHMRCGFAFYPGNVPEASPQPLSLLDVQSASS